MIGALDGLTASVNSLDGEGLAQLERQALQRITPVIRSWLLADFEASGLKSRTGALRKAIASSVLTRTRKDIRVGFPSGLAGSGRGKGKERSVYVYGAALNYGAVHGMAGSQKGKVKLKRAAAASKTARVSKRGSIHLGAGHVRKAYHFFRLDLGQQAQATALFEKELDRLIAEKLKKAA